MRDALARVVENVGLGRYARDYLASPAWEDVVAAARAALAVLAPSEERRPSSDAALTATLDAEVTATFDDGTSENDDER